SGEGGGDCREALARIVEPRGPRRPTRKVTRRKSVRAQAENRASSGNRSGRRAGELGKDGRAEAPGVLGGEGCTSDGSAGAPACQARTDGGRCRFPAGC